MLLGSVISGSWRKNLSTMFFQVNETCHTETTTDAFLTFKTECSWCIFSFKYGLYSKSETPNFRGHYFLLSHSSKKIFLQCRFGSPITKQKKHLELNFLFTKTNLHIKHGFFLDE